MGKKAVIWLDIALLWRICTCLWLVKMQLHSHTISLASHPPNNMYVCKIWAILLRCITKGCTCAISGYQVTLLPCGLGMRLKLELLLYHKKSLVNVSIYCIPNLVVLYGW